MATHINPYLYTGGAVKLDSTPQTNMLIQALARKQAQQESLDQYYRNVQERLSEKEIRPVDTEGFQNKFNDLQDYYVRNKKAVLGGNITASNEYNQRFRDLMSDAQKSKAAAGQELMAAQHHFSGKWQPTTEDFEKVLPSMSSSIYDKNHYKDETGTSPYTVNDLSIYVPDLDEKKYLQTLTFGQKPSETAVGQPENLGNWRMRQNYEVGYNDKQLKDFGDKALADANTNPSVKKLASNRFDYIDLNPQMKDDLNNVYKRVYGTDATSPADFYAADVIQNLGSKENKSKEYEDTYSKTRFTQDQINKRLALSNAFQRGRMEFGHALTQADKQTANLWIDDYINGLASDAMNKPAVDYKTAKGDITKEHIIPLDATLAKSLAKDGIQPDQLRVTQDGNFRPVWFKRDKDGTIKKSGDVAAVDDIRSIPISQDQVKLALGKASAGTKQTNIEMNAPTKTYRHLGKTYTQDQIERGAKYYGLSVKDYLKQLGIK